MRCRSTRQQTPRFACGTKDDNNGLAHVVGKWGLEATRTPLYSWLLPPEAALVSEVCSNEYRQNTFKTYVIFRLLPSPSPQT